MRTIYKCPRWLSDQGCHLCIAKGERMGRSVSWCITAPSIWNKRTHASILRDAEANQNGLGGLTQMMDFFTMERCRVDALHALSEGVSCDLFREMLSPKRRVPELKISTASKKLLSEALESARNYTYAAKFVLGLKDLSKCTASEKDAIMFLMFPLVATKRMCADDCGSSCVLIYWALVRSLQKSSELTSETMSRIRELANALKSLWRSVSKQLFTLKLHCVIDHSCLEDLQDVGTAYQWSAEGFEKMHRTLQLRHSQSATNCEELLMKNFVLRRELNELLRIEICRSAEPCCSRLYQKIQGDAVKRFPALVRLTSGWYIPTNSEIRDVRPEHAGEIQRLLCQQYNLSSRLCYASKVYTSHYYWTRKKDTRSDVLYLNVNGNAMFGSVVLFAYEAHGECVVLLEELVTDDPFAGLFSELRTSQHQACLQAVVATDTVRRYNNFFYKRSSGSVRHNVSDFPAYERDIESDEEFASKKIRVVLTMNFDGVLFNKLTRSQAWPIYIRLEGLQFNMKNDPENMILPAITFLRKPPTEELLRSLFSRLKEELRTLKEGGVRVQDSTRTVWTCYPQILNGVIDFAQIVANRLKDPRVSLSELKDIQMAVKHLPPSSDTVVQSMQELLLKTCSIATGLAMVLDHVLVNTASLRTDIAQTSAHMHVLARLKLPDDTVLSHLNLTKRWTIAASPPFKEKDLKSLMTHWKIPARADKRDHVTHCTDFARMYFATACDPVEDVKKYAVRVSGKHAKDPRKMDLPADIRDTLIKCFLDGLKMGQPELDRMPYELAAQPTQFWLDLGPTNETRAAKLLERQAARDAWTSALKSALGRALNNVRQYVKKGSALVPVSDLLTYYTKKKNSRNAND
ncbi:unnamed protein product [Heligmosomoides polygyrus]|uniref:ANK_REP_REGION domain-containing protein n=1 Tax=Heligmosomoides polygyrus TaxID=6339 RepID=A0A183FZW6_HELPZ|nr:unnamed protein product [Heligmosomoides polygyrus]